MKSACTGAVGAVTGVDKVEATVEVVGTRSMRACRDRDGV